LRFSRVAGGPNGFCGVGPFFCFLGFGYQGKGHFLDVAMADDSICAVDGSGFIECPHGNRTQPTRFQAKRIAGSGHQFCALGQTGKVACFHESRSGSVASPPPKLKAKYIAVADEFACAANENSELVCWGKTEALQLPEAPLLIRDLAAGSDFVCVMPKQGPHRCFGDAPELSAGDAKSIGAGFDSFCTVSKEGAGRCAGDITHKFKGEVKRFAFSASAVCAHLESGALECVDKSGKELDAPVDSSQYLQAVHDIEAANRAAKKKAREAQQSLDDAARAKKREASKALLDEMLPFFANAELPLSFDREARFSFGDRLPSRFNGLVDGWAADYLAGIQIKLPNKTQIATVFHLPSGEPRLLVYNAGELSDEVNLGSLDLDSGRIGKTSIRTAKGLLRKIDAEGTLITSEMMGTETTYFTSTKKSAKVSRIQCTVRGESWTQELASGLGSKQKGPQPKGVSTSTMEGCGSIWPFEEAPEAIERAAIENVAAWMEKNGTASTPEADSTNPCSALTRDNGKAKAGVRQAEFAHLAGSSNRGWVSAKGIDIIARSMDGGDVFGSMTASRGQGLWQFREMGEDFSRNGVYTEQTCYRADGSLAYFERSRTGSSGTIRKVLAYDGSGKAASQEWSFSNFDGPLKRADFNETELAQLSDATDPPKKLKAHQFYSMSAKAL